MSIPTGEQTLGYLVNLKHAQHMISYTERLDVGGMVVTKGGGGDGRPIHNICTTRSCYTRNEPQFGNLVLSTDVQ